MVGGLLVECASYIAQGYNKSQTADQILLMEKGDFKSDARENPFSITADT